MPLDRRINERSCAWQTDFKDLLQASVDCSRFGKNAVCNFYAHYLGSFLSLVIILIVLFLLVVLLNLLGSEMILPV